MPSLTPNIENRVRKLPKPSNATQGLQPLFEAVSNAFYAVEDRFGAGDLEKGHVTVTVTSLSDSDGIEVSVTDNGIGMDTPRYEAFCEIDTDFKRAKGGKGVGRLFWLDAFKHIAVESTYLNGTELATRRFGFALKNTDQITPLESARNIGPAKSVGTAITFKSLRTKEYADHFPKRADTFLRYFSAHFIADFLLGGGPRVTVVLDDQATKYPNEVTDLVVGTPLQTGTIITEDFGPLSITGFTCRSEASTGLDGNHQLHLLANGRTVETRKVDNLLGLTNLERNAEQDLVFHGCVSGEYLDVRVNEGRTAFNIPEKTLKDISRVCMDAVKQRLLPEQIRKYEAQRRESYEDFVSRHPIYGFDDAETQLDRVPFHAIQSEDFAAGLVKYQIRRDEGREDALQDIIRTLDLEHMPEDFGVTVAEAARDIHASEQLALAQHVVRRKLVLELLEKLLARMRRRDGQKEDHQLEKTLHSFICPMGVRGDNPAELESRAHDLWLVDERLAFTTAFSSDNRLSQVLSSSSSAGRPDLLIWDLAYGMGVAEPENGSSLVDTSEPLKKMMIVEFKRPGRTSYAKAEDQIESQITKYLAELKSGDIETFDRQRVRIADDCIFYCFIVADIIGDLTLQLSNWEATANGQGRIRPLKNQYRGSIEVIQWQDLVNDAWQRNRAMITAAGLSRSKPTLGS